MACTLRGVALAVTRLHCSIGLVMQPIGWVLQHRSWWDHPPAWARWAQPGDRKFTRRLMVGCVLVGAIAAFAQPFGFVIAGPMWLGMTIALGLFPTRRRLLLAVLASPVPMWPWWPMILFDSDWVPWSVSGGSI